jgi:predicted pyridoxine 5'-phosphate oxidase superfamily flavin-nucleotide-binding protein
MSRSFAERAFTPLVKKQQEQHGSRRQYARMEEVGEAGDRLTDFEREFIAGRDGFYMSSTGETGWPYIQYRGGEKGFLHVLDDQTLGFADLRGNKQYITMGNLEHDDRVALFLMDYAHQMRLKILGRAVISETNGGESDAAAAELIAKLKVPGEKTPTEHAVIVHVEAFDWNCPQHITPRYTQEELAGTLEPVRKRMEALEKENARLRGLVAGASA